MDQNPITFSSQFAIRLDPMSQSQTRSLDFDNPRTNFDPLAIENWLAEITIDMRQNEGQIIPASLRRPNTDIYQIPNTGCFNVGKNDPIVDVPENIQISKADFNWGQVAKIVHKL
jgi:hypothetical protein